jgi:hypothetical protein
MVDMLDVVKSNFVLFRKKPIALLRYINVAPFGEVFLAFSVALNLQVLIIMCSDRG